MIHFFSNLEIQRRSMAPPPAPAVGATSTRPTTTATSRQVPEPTSDERAEQEQREMVEIQRLIKMGFQEGDVIIAYYQSCRNVRQAAHKLVDIMF